MSKPAVVTKRSWAELPIAEGGDGSTADMVVHEHWVEGEDLVVAHERAATIVGAIGSYVAGVIARFGELSGPHPTIVHAPAVMTHELMTASVVDWLDIYRGGQLMHLHHGLTLEKHAWERMIEELRGVHEATTSPFLRDSNDLARLFQENARKWKEETWMLSSITDKVQDPAYVGIIALGPQVVPLILAELQTEPGYWFWALQMITREDPVPADADFDEAVEAWLEWGRAKGYLPADQPFAFPEE